MHRMNVKRLTCWSAITMDSRWPPHSDVKGSKLCANALLPLPACGEGRAEEEVLYASGDIMAVATATVAAAGELWVFRGRGSCRSFDIMVHISGNLEALGVMQASFTVHQNRVYIP